MTEDGEQRIRQVFARWKSSRPGAGGHPDEETLVLFIDGKLPRSEESGVKEHILSCPSCGAACRCQLLFQPPAEDAPAQLLERVRRLLAERLGLYAMELVLVSRESLLQVLNTSGDILVGQELVPAALLRSRNIQDFKDEVTVFKDLRDLRIELKVERRDKSFCVSVTCREKETQHLFAGLRMALFRDDRELESSVAETGKVSFERVRPGKYIIEISSLKEKMAALFLEIRV